MVQQQILEHSYAPNNAYRQAQTSTESPRQTEYRLFAQVTSALMAAREGEFTAMVKAVNWNRRLWLVLQTDCASEDNALPDSLRAGIISLAIWVDKHSRKVMSREGQVEPLIEVNRSIMEGLIGSPQ
jgi:flagellar protein FlaF